MRAVALASTTALKTLDLAYTNLCNCTPTATTATRLEWSGEAIAALAGALTDSSVSELHLGHNGLCGLWTENICGEVVTRGSYTAVAIDALVGAFGAARIAMKREGLKFDDHNFVRAADAERLARVCKENASKPQRKDMQGLSGAQIIAPVTDVKESKKESDEVKAAAAKAADAEPVIDLNSVIVPGKQDAMALRKKAGAGGGTADIKVMLSLIHI